jgi:hypothetical protein
MNAANTHYSMLGAHSRRIDWMLGVGCWVLGVHFLPPP